MKGEACPWGAKNSERWAPSLAVLRWEPAPSLRAESPSKEVRGWALLPAGWLPFLLLLAERRGQWAGRGGLHREEDPAGGENCAH